MASWSDTDETFMLIAFRSDRISVETSKRRTSKRRKVRRRARREWTEGQNDRFVEGQNRKTTATGGNCGQLDVNFCPDNFTRGS